jgi:hypothetical protein
MKRNVTVGIVFIVLVAASARYWLCARGASEPAENSHLSNDVGDVTHWYPTDAEAMNQNQGVGWVFGRVMGVSEAPGSVANSPFGRSTN